MDLNKEQLRAVESDAEAILVLAVPGAGKTTCLVERVKRLISAGVSPREMMIVTFTRKAAQMLKERLSSFLPEQDIRKMYIGTSHSFCCRVIHDFAEWINYSKDFSIYDDIDRQDVLKAIISEYKYKVKIKAMLKKIMLARQCDFDPTEQKVWDEYVARLRKYNALDYDLLLEYAIRILKEPTAVEHYRNRYRYIFYDEFHDIADLEDQMLLTLAIRNSFVVGDFSQEIYGFRGTSNEYILRYRDRHPGCAVVKLPINYRSAVSICKAAENLINHNPQPFGKYEIIPFRQDKGEIHYGFDLRDGEAEKLYIAGKLRHALVIDGADPRDWVILTRTNRQLFEIRDELQNWDIPVQLVRRDAFWNREEIRNTLAFLRLMVNPRDDFSMSRVLRLPCFKVGGLMRRQIRIFALKEDLSLLEACTRIVRIKTDQGFIPLSIPSPLISEIPTEATALDAFNIFASTSIYIAFLQEQNLVTKVKSVLSISQKIEEFEAEEDRTDFSLQAFLESISLESAIDRWDEKIVAVNLMTIHCAKGLEFENVIVAGCEEGLLPLRGAKLEEERRLMFVAVTRAKTRLLLTGARARVKFGQIIPAGRSCFEKEMVPNVS